MSTQATRQREQTFEAFAQAAQEVLGEEIHEIILLLGFGLDDSKDIHIRFAPPRFSARSTSKQNQPMKRCTQ